jgi:hypothetical protein
LFFRALVLVPLLGACTSLNSIDEYAGSTWLPLAVTVTADPAPDANGLIARDAVVRVVFDDYPDPDTALFGPLLLRSGKGNFDVDVRVDLANKSILVHPRSLLQPDAQYELLLAPDVRALDGRTVPAGGFVALISVGETIAGTGGADPISWSRDVAPPLQQCSPACHAPPQSLRSLDFLRPPDDPMYGLIGVPSLSQEGTAHPLARVQPLDSARSVLLRKLLGGNAHEAAGDPPYPEMGIDGRRMPIQANPLTQPVPPPPLDLDTIKKIQLWIDQGAIVDTP